MTYDLKNFGSAVNKAMTAPLNQNQFDVWVNTGSKRMQIPVNHQKNLCFYHCQCINAVYVLKKPLRE